MTPGTPVIGCLRAFLQGWGFVQGGLNKSKCMITHMLLHQNSKNNPRQGTMIEPGRTGNRSATFPQDFHRIVTGTAPGSRQGRRNGPAGPHRTTHPVIPPRNRPTFRVFLRLGQPAQAGPRRPQPARQVPGTFRPKGPGSRHLRAITGQAPRESAPVCPQDRRRQAGQAPGQGQAGIAPRCPAQSEKPHRRQDQGRARARGQGGQAPGPESLGSNCLDGRRTLRALRPHRARLGKTPRIPGRFSGEK